MTKPGSMAAQGEPACGICGDRFASTLDLGRHVRDMHRVSLAQVQGNQFPNGNPYAYSDHSMTAQDMMELDHDVDVDVSEETFAFYEHFHDTSSLLFESEPDVSPPLDALCQRARAVLRFCCKQQSTQGEARQHYLLETSGDTTGVTCPCQSALKEQFPSAIAFSNYLSRCRRLFVRGQQWRRASIDTEYGMNTTGAFRPILPVVTAVVQQAGGFDSILPYQQSVRGGQRVYSTFADTDTLRLLTASAVAGTRLLCLDVYADGTTLARSGSQSVCVVRVRVANVRGQMNAWHDVGLCPILPSETSYTDKKLGQARLLLLHRFLHLILRDVIIASKSGVIMDSRLVMLRVVTFVADQKQERSFLALKSAGSYMDCSMCIMPSRAHEDDGQTAIEDVPLHLRNVSASDVYTMQTSRDGCAPRNVLTTVRQQLIVAKSARDGHGNSHEVRHAKKYLNQVSAGPLPSVFASVRGLGSPPFFLFEAVGLDRLHAIDLGLLRDFPDLAFRLFGEEQYNKGLVSRLALVRTANQRFKDLPRAAGTHLCPFRSGANEAHSAMTGAKRRAAAPLLWVSVLALQPLQVPDDDLLVQAALAVNDLQIRLRGVNLPDEERSRSHSSINEVQEVGFRAGLYMSKALGMPINTKTHRVMHHIRHHLLRYGDARIGDSDRNESMHKDTKKSYASTNNHASELAPQILSARSVALPDLLMDHESQGANLSEDSFCFMMRRTVLISSVTPTDTPIVPLTYEIDSSEFADTPPQRDLLGTLAAAMSTSSVEHALSAALEITDAMTLRSIWRRRTKLYFNARLHWLTEESENKTNRRQIAYAGDNVNGAGARFDGIEYDSDGAVCKGILLHILHGSALGARCTVAIIKRLRRAAPQLGNTKVVEIYGHQRFSYAFRALHDADVVLDVVPLRDIRRVVVLVRDMFDVVTRHGIEKRMNQVMEDILERRRSHFFEVNGVQVTSFT